MDMDIDDILASVDRENEKTVRSSKAGRRGHTDDAYDGYGDSAANIDHQELTRLWVAERGTSELLPWPTGLMERMMNRIRRQVRDLPCSLSVFNILFPCIDCTTLS